MATFKDYLQEAAYINNTSDVNDNKGYHVKHVMKHKELSAEFSEKHMSATDDSRKNHFKKLIDAHNEASAKHYEALKMIRQKGDGSRAYKMVLKDAKRRTQHADRMSKYSRGKVL